MKDDVKLFLQEVRDHPLWPDVVRAIQPPRVPAWRSDRALEEWAYYSGRREEYEKIMWVLTGKDPTERQSEED